MTSATVRASTAVETAAPVETSSSVKTSTEARLPARGEASGDSSMIKAAEGAGMSTRLGTWCRNSMLRGYETMLRC